MAVVCVMLVSHGIAGSFVDFVLNVVVNNPRFWRLVLRSCCDGDNRSPPQKQFISISGQ